MAIDFAQIMDCAGEKGRKIAPSPHRNIVGYEYVTPSTKHFLPDYVYMSDLPLNLGEMQNANLIVLTELHSLPLVADSNNILFTEDSQLFTDICNQVKKLFNMEIRVNNFISRLLLMINDEHCIENMMNETYQTIGNPLMLVDPSLFLLRHAGMESVENEELVKFTLTNGYLPEEYLQEVINEEERHNPLNKNPVIIWEKDFLQHRIFACRILKNNKLVAYLKVLEYNKLITKTDEELIMVLCHFLSVVINESFIEDPTSQPQITAFLTALLDQKITEPGAIENRINLLKIDYHEYKYILTVDSIQDFKTSERLFALKRRFSTILERSTIVVYKGQLVILYSAKKPDGIPGDLLNKFSELLKSNNCTAFLSMPFREFHDFHKHYAQTQSCILVADKLRLDEPVIKYEDYVIEHMLLLFAENFNLEDMIHPGIKDIMEIDRQKNSNMVSSLFCYMECCRDVTLTAKTLHIHYNTLRYRINRIIELTNIDFSDHSVIFSLLLSHKILKLLYPDFDYNADNLGDTALEKDSKDSLYA